MENKAIFNELYHLDVNEYVERKNDLSYLTWSYAWAELKKRYPDATYEIVMFDGKPYIYDEKTGYMVFTKLTINGLTHDMWLPVMDESNKAMLDRPYKYKVFKYVNGKKVWNKERKEYEMTEKSVKVATMFEINKAIMRCLVKNIAMFGLGLYIYAGEDLPEQIEQDEQDEQIEQNGIAKGEGFITETQIKMIERFFGNKLSDLLKKNGLTKLIDMSREKADELVKKIQEKENENNE